MSARIKSVAAGTSDDPAINSLIDFAKNGFGDTQMFGLLARRPELLKRTASMFAYFLAGEGGLIEPRLLELMRVRGAHLNACTYCATLRLQPVAEEVKAKEPALGHDQVAGRRGSAGQIGQERIQLARSCRHFPGRSARGRSAQR